MDGNNGEKELSSALDLSTLSSLNLEPSWASGDKQKKISVDRVVRDDRRGNAPWRERRDGGNPRDRRPPRSREGGGPSDRGAPRGDSRSFSGGDRAPQRDRGNAPGRFPNKRFAGNMPPPRVVEASFFPEEKPFAVLSKAIKNSARTYALFEIANLILEKPERFTVSVKPFVRKSSAPKGKDAPVENAPAKETSDASLFVCVPDGVPFLNEADALAYVFAQHAERFFTVETVEVEAPKGNFTMVSKCGFTGELLAPPNYHGYQQILRDHHTANFPKMAFEKFMSRLETVKDQVSIDNWVAKMKTVVRYTPKDRKEDEPEVLDGVGAAKAFLLSNRKKEAVRAVGTAHFPGKLLEQMPMGPMRAGIENELAFQRRFPLDTANALRGRLRRAGFSLFKRGSKGITLVCAIRRKFRTPDSVFSETIQRVFDFLEKHPNTKVQDLPKKMLGIEDEPVVAPVETTPPAEASPAPHVEQNADANADVPSEATTPVAPEVAVEAPATPAPSAEKAEKDAQLSELLGTVRWLVIEGYVSELSDGSLFTYPKMTVAQVKTAGKEETSESKTEDAVGEEKTDDIAAEIPPAPEVVAPVPAEVSTDASSEISSETEVVSETEQAKPETDESSPSEESPVKTENA